MRELRSVAGIVGRASRQLSSVSYSPAIKRVVDESAAAIKKNQKILLGLPREKIAAYVDHLGFLRPDGFESVADVADVSCENLAKYADIVSKVPLASDWSFSDEEELLRRVDDLVIELRHSSQLPELVVDDEEIRSRSSLGNEAVGLMKKRGDSEYRYDGFVFSSVKCLPPDSVIEPEDNVFKYPLFPDTCMFLKDCFSFTKRHIVGEESSFPGSASKKSFNGVYCYTETNYSKFRFHFKEGNKTKHITDFICRTKQFSFGEVDIRGAIALTAIMHSRAFGREYLLDLDKDEDFAYGVSCLSGFETRSPHSVPFEKGVVHSYKETDRDQGPSEKMTPKERQQLVDEMKDLVEAYNGNVW